MFRLILPKHAKISQPTHQCLLTFVECWIITKGGNRNFGLERNGPHFYTVIDI